jgi:hypothetical protein
MYAPREIRKIVRGLKVTQPDMWPEEQILWSARANRKQNALRAVGGRLYVTDRRVLFGPNNADKALAGKEWDAPLTDVQATEVGGLMRTMRVHLRDGSTESFVVRPASDAMEAIQAAVDGASGEEALEDTPDS